MKRIINKLVLGTTAIVGLVFFVLSCNNEEIGKETSSSNQRLLSNNDSLYIEITDNLYDLKFFSAFANDSIVESNLVVFYDNDSIFRIDYSFNTEESHWKLKQAPAVISEAVKLKSKNISGSILEEVDRILNVTVGYIYYETVGVKNDLVVSSLNYHKSIVNSVVRDAITHEGCNCTVHPAFLTEQTFFNCQEEHFYEVSRLKEILNEYAMHYELDESTENLMEFLDTYEEETLRFDEYYSFYIDRGDFELLIDNMITNASSGCGWWCLLGCGSDHDCCGNYSGCCLYWHPACYVHDKMCKDCEPAWFCLPGCKPDPKPSKNVQEITYN